MRIRPDAEIMTFSEKHWHTTKEKLLPPNVVDGEKL